MKNLLKTIVITVIFLNCLNIFSMKKPKKPISDYKKTKVSPQILIITGGKYLKTYNC